MTAPPIFIVGFASDDFVPGFVGQTVFGAGPSTPGSQPIKLMLVGNMGSGGTAVADQDVDQIFSAAQADDLYDPGSELASMCRAALPVPGVTIYGAPVAASGGSAATLTITFATNANSAGTWYFRVAGRRLVASVDSGDTPTNQGDELVSFISARPTLPFTAANVAGTVTLTWKQTGLRGNQAIAFKEEHEKPGGTTCTLGGTGAAVTGGGKKFGGGTTADDVTNVANDTFAGHYQRVALAANDAANLAAWETHEDSKAGPLEMRPEHTVVASNDSLVNTTSLAQTTLNNPRFQMLWQLNGETPPCEVAAVFAAIRSATETSNPNASYDDVILPGVAMQSQDADIAQRVTLVSALKNSVTPITNYGNDGAAIVRSITSKSLTGASPDYRALDTGWTSLGDFVLFAAQVLYADWKTANPVVRDDPATEEKDPPAGVGYPRTWNAVIEDYLLSLEDGSGINSNIPQVIDVALNKPVSGWDKDAKRIMTLIPVVPHPANHQLGAEVHQL